MDGVPYDDWLQQQVKKYEHNESFKSLDGETTKAAFETAKTAFLSFTQQAKHFKPPLQVNAKLKEFNDLLAAYNGAVSEMVQLAECVDQIKEKCANEDSAAKRDWKEQAAKHERFYATQGRSVPGALSRAYSWATYAMARNPDEVGIAPAPSVPELVFGDVVPTDIFDVASTVRCIADDADQATKDAATPYHEKIKAYVVAQRGPAKAFLASQVDKLMKKENQLGSSGHLDRAIPFPWSADDDITKSFFRPLPADTREVVFAGKCCWTDLDVIGWPYRGVACWVHVYTGTVVVLILKPDDIEQRPDLKIWLEGEKIDALQKHQVCLLSEGDSIWIPPGHSPLVMGLPSDRAFNEKIPKLALRGRRVAGQAKAKDPQQSLFCIGVNLCLRRDTDVNMRPALLSSVTSSFARAMAYLPKQIKADVKDWFAVLSAKVQDGGTAP